MVCDGCANKSLEGNSSLIISNDLSPLILITAMAPTPGAVATATIVSLQPESLLIMAQRYAQTIYG